MNLAEFEALALRKLGHDEFQLRGLRSECPSPWSSPFANWILRPKVLVDVSKCSAGITLGKFHLNAPILLDTTRT